MRTFVIAFVLLRFLPAYAISEADANKLAPGDLCSLSDRDFTELRYPEQIPYCKRNVSTSTKNRIKRSWGIPERDWQDYQVDHVNSLVFGGSNSERNLMPLHYAIHSEKEHVESVLYGLIKKGGVTQQTAVDMLAQWRRICLFGNQCAAFDECVDTWAANGAWVPFTCFP